MSRFRTIDRLPTWRRVAASSWTSESEASIQGWIDVDVSALLPFIDEVRRLTHTRVTLTHLVGKAVALAFAEAPQCNAYVSLGRMRQRETVDVFFSVAVGDGKNLSGAKVEAADALSVAEIARSLEGTVRRIRTTGDTDLQRSQSLLRSIPAPLLGSVLRLTARAMYDVGLDLSWAGVPPDPFGTAVVTNVGVLGVEQGFAPFVPQGRAVAMFTVGKIRDKVVAVDGEPRVRPVVTIGGTFDHRVVDGYHLGHMTRCLQRVLEQPTLDELCPEVADARRDSAPPVSRLSA